MRIENDIKLDFKDGSGHFVLMVRREGTAAGTGLLDGAQLVVLAKKRVTAEAGLADYRFAQFGHGPGMLAVALVAELDALEGVLPAVRLDTTTPEGAIALVELSARAELVVR